MTFSTTLEMIGIISSSIVNNNHLAQVLQPNDGMNHLNSTPPIMTTSFSEPCAEWIFSFPLVLSSLTNTSTFQNTTQEQVRNCPDTIMVPISSGLFLLGYSTLIVASIVGLIWKRNSGHIRARTVSGMIFTIISSFLFVLGIQIRYVIGRAVYPCILYSIFFVVMPPCVAMPTILRLLRFYAQFQVSKMKSQQLTHLDQLSDQTMRGELSTTENNNSDLVSPRDNSMKNMNQRQQSNQISSPSMSVKCTSRTSNNFMQQYKLGFKERIWYRMNDLLSRHTYIMMFLIAILGVHVVLWFCITVIENSFFAEDRFFMTNDSMSLFGCGAQYFPSVLALFIYCGFFCIECLCALLLLVRTDSDTWYIKKEALCLIPIQVLLGSLFLVTEFVEIFRILDHIVPSGTIMTTYTGIEIFVTIFLPICYAIYQDEKPKSEVYDTEMEMILNNKQAFESFLDHCRRSFCAEGLLFYKDLEKYKQCSSSTQRRDMALHIVQCYLVQGAPQELNIGNIETLREEILFVIHTNNHTVNKLPDHLFDRVKSVALTLKSKPQLILEAIQHNDLSSIDNPNLLKDREFIQKCVQLSGPSIRHFINQALDRETVLAAVKQDGHALAYFRQTDFHNDREVVSQAVQQNGHALEYASVKLRADKEIVLQAVRQDPSAKQYACHELQLDSDVFLASICPNVAHKYSNTNWNNNATWLFETLKHDPEFIMDAVSRNGFSLEHASIDLKRKKEIVLAAVRNQPHALKYTVDDLKNDREVVLEAAQRDGTSLQYASTRLRSDKELILLTNILAFEYASNTLKNDKDFVLKILRKFGGAALQYVGYSLRSDKDVVLQAVSMADRHYRTLEHASKSLLKDRDVVLAAVKACGLALLCVSELWGHDKEIVLEAVKHDKLAFNYATKELKADKDVVWAAMGSGLKGVQVLDKQEAVETLWKGLGLPSRCLSERP